MAPRTANTARTQPVPVRFEVADNRDRRRLRWGTTWYVGAWSKVLSAAHRAFPASLAHRLERRWARSVIRHLDIEFDVEGLERITSGPYVVVPLHEGLVDAAVVLTLALDLRFLVRDEMFGWPLLRSFLHASHQLEVPTTGDVASGRALMQCTGEALRSGESVVVFAQGSVLGLEVAFKEGPARIAAHHGVPILPVVITGTHRIWEHPYSPTVRYHQRVSLRVLAAIDPTDEEGVAGLQARMKAAALGQDMAPARRFEPELDGWWDGYDYDIDPAFADLAERVTEHRASL